MKRHFLIVIAGMIMLCSSAGHAWSSLLTEGAKKLVEIIVSGVGWDALKGLGKGIVDVVAGDGSDSKSGYTSDGHMVVFVARAPKTAELKGSDTEKTYSYVCSASAMIYYSNGNGGFERDGYPCAPLDVSWNAGGCQGSGSPFTVSGTSTSERTIANRCDASFRGAMAQLMTSTKLVFASLASPVQSTVVPYEPGIDLRGWM